MVEGFARKNAFRREIDDILSAAGSSSQYIPVPKRQPLAEPPSEVNLTARA